MAREGDASSRPSSGHARGVASNGIKMARSSTRSSSFLFRTCAGFRTPAVSARGWLRHAGIRKPAQNAKFFLAAATLGVALAPEVASYCLGNPYSCTATINAAGDATLCVSTNVCGTLTPAAVASKEAAAALEAKFAAEAKLATEAKLGAEAAYAKPKLGDYLDPADIERIEQIRGDLKLTSNNARDRNIAFAEGHVDGADIGEIVGVSGERGPGVAMPEKRIFTTGTDKFPREWDFRGICARKPCSEVIP